MFKGFLQVIPVLFAAIAGYILAFFMGMEAYGAKIITLKDMAGLVNPLRAASLISKIKAAVNVPVDFHTHCTPGYGLASVVMAMLHGVSYRIEFNDHRIDEIKDRFEINFVISIHDFT
jgi:hypothetical protein